MQHFPATHFLFYTRFIRSLQVTVESLPLNLPNRTTYLKALETCSISATIKTNKTKGVVYEIVFKK